MSKKRGFTPEQFKKTGIDKSPYQIITEEGNFTGSLDFKIWSDSKLLSYFTLEDGRKIFAATWRHDNYLGLDVIDPGAKVALYFQKASSNNVYLKKANKA